MTIFAVITISVLTTLATVAFLLYAAKRLWQRRRHAWLAGEKLSGGWCNKHRSPGQSRSMEDTLAWLESILKLDSQQRNLWASLKQELIEGKQNLAAYREVLTDTGDVQQSVHRLDDFLSDCLIVLRKLKPKLIEFYHSLNSQQQQTFNTLLGGEFLRPDHCRSHKAY